MNTTPSRRSKSMACSGVVALCLLLGLLCFPEYFWYGETKGPFKNWMQVVDWDGDGDLDVLVSHTRWEDVSISWAGIGIWVNQGEGTFELLRDRGDGSWPFVGHAAVAGDIDRDGDLDVFTQDFGIHLLLNQGGLQEGETGWYLSSGGINAPASYHRGYRDMGGTITLGDLNGDGWLDAFVASCCYGMDAREPGSDMSLAPSVSWVWINDSGVMDVQTGHILPLDDLDGLPIRQVALGDLDGDGDTDVFAAVGSPTLGTAPSQGGLILLNDGAGNLSLYGQLLGDTDSTSVALGDVNSDGRLDALVGTDDGARLWLNQGNETGSGGPVFIPAEQSFEAVQTVKNRLAAGFSSAADQLLGLYLPHGSVRTQAVFLSDLDGDGDLDTLLARLWGAEVWWNDGHGEFRRSELGFEYREDTGVAVADFDADGGQDIFVGRNEVDYQVWLNDGSGGFTEGTRN